MVHSAILVDRAAALLVGAVHSAVLAIPSSLRDALGQRRSAQ